MKELAWYLDTIRSWNHLIFLVYIYLYRIQDFVLGCFFFKYPFLENCLRYIDLCGQKQTKNFLYS